MRTNTATPHHQGTRAHPHTQATIEPGFIYIHSLASFYANVTLSRVLMVCSWPVAGVAAKYTTDPYAQGSTPTSAQSLQRVAQGLVNLDAYGFVSNTSSGDVLNATSLVTHNFSFTPFALDGSLGPAVGGDGGTGVVPATLTCVARRVISVGGLVRALTELQRVSQQTVLVQVMANLSVSDLEAQLPGVWSDTTAVHIYRNVTLIGEPNVGDIGHRVGV